MPELRNPPSASRRGESGGERAQTLPIKRISGSLSGTDFRIIYVLHDTLFREIGDPNRFWPEKARKLPARNRLPASSTASARGRRIGPNRLTNRPANGIGRCAASNPPALPGNSSPLVVPSTICSAPAVVGRPTHARRAARRRSRLPFAAPGWPRFDGSTNP
jgi:hypothetical protein